jgi:F-type H+-transporting ATPase subunit b
MDFIGKVINFIVLFGGLFLILRKPVKNYLNERSQNVDLSIKEAVETKEQSEKKLKSVLGRLNELSDEVKKIKDEAEIEGNKQKESIIKSARQEAKRLKDLTGQEIDSLYSLGLKEIRAYAAEKAIEAASKRIKQRMTSKLQSDMIDKSIKRLDKLYENSDSS